MATEIQDFLYYIKSMGIEAWIPDTPGHGPKMSVSEQCQSKILCLEYKGTDIYIRGNKCRTINREIHKNNNPAVDVKNNIADGSKSDNVCYKICHKILQNYNLVDSENMTEKCGCDFKIKMLPARILEEQGRVENGKLLPEMGGQQFKRIVNEKLTKEVRVAKCYVSSLPSRIYNTEGYENPIEVKQQKPKRGFVRQLIKLFNADDFNGTKYV